MRVTHAYVYDWQNQRKRDTITKNWNIVQIHLYELWIGAKGIYKTLWFGMVMPYRDCKVHIYLFAWMCFSVYGPYSLDQFAVLFYFSVLLLFFCCYFTPFRRVLKYYTFWRWSLASFFSLSQDFGSSLNSIILESTILYKFFLSFNLIYLSTCFYSCFSGILFFSLL